MRVLKESFNAGEFTPRLHSRYELAKYKNGCKTLTNFVPLPHGPVTRRPGTEYIAAVKTAAKYTRLIPFEFSEDDSYIIEFGHEYVRFYRNGGQVQTVDSDTKLLLHFDGDNNSTTITDSGDTTHVITVNGDAKLKTAVKKFGSASCYFDGTLDNITAPDHADWVFGADAFTIDFWVRFDRVDASQGLYSQDDDVDVHWLYFDHANDQLVFQIYDATVKTVEILAAWNPSVDTWYHLAVIRGWAGNANDWAITVDGTSIGTVTDASVVPDSTDPLTIGSGTGAYRLFGYLDEFRVSKGVARWTANFAPPTSQYPFGDDSGAVYEVATTYIEADLPTLQFVQSADVMYIVHKDYVVRSLTRSDHASWAIANVVFTDPPAAWSANDYPRTVEFYEDRLCFGGSPDQPDTIWTSKVGSYLVFTVGAAAADDPITLTLLARKVNDIAWLSSGRRLLSGTIGEEWWVAGPSDTEPITPANNVAKRDSAWGSEPIMPVNIGDVVFYLQQNGKILRELIYDFSSDRYKSSDMSVLAEHLTRTYSITAMAYQQHPYQILWCVRSDGTVLALTYLKEHEVVGWSTHNIGGGEVESVAVISGDPEDEVWFVVKRTVNSAVVRYIEKLKDFNFGTALEDAFFVDSGLSYEGAAATTISGLSHLEGEAVTVLADGLTVTGKTVSSGAITLSTAASKVHVGLVQTPELETLDAVTQDDEGTLQGVLKRITNVTMRLVSSAGGQFGPDSSATDDIPYDDSTTPYTGWTDDLSFDEGFDKTSTVYITSDEPLPLEIAAIMIDLEDD
ncbi:MAG: hypothetical protein BBJ57_02165 [Desulfobacterales bacterium PC51MH44]|nr:MAG: hypothetical protein BBJ57_02165 [Desulfobacterales bacterium PC51MH44]